MLVSDSTLNTPSGCVSFTTPTTTMSFRERTVFIRLWDMGPKAGPPGVPRLVCELSTSTTGGPQSLEEVLTVVAGGVASDDNKILDVPRMYELSVLMSGTVADTTYVGSAGLEVR